MKKNIFRLMSLLAILFLITSCDTDNDIENTPEGLKLQSVENLQHTQDKGFTKNSSLCDIRISFEGTISGNGETGITPHVGTFLNLESPYDGSWSVSNEFQIIGDSRGKKLRVLRVGREEGTIVFFTRIGSQTRTCERTFPEAPLGCPDRNHATIHKTERAGGSRLRLTPRGYNSGYNYLWKIEDINGTSHKTGSSVNINIDEEDVTVTLEVSLPGSNCPVQTKTSTYLASSSFPDEEE
ncbi:hypothetical protein [Aquimarina algicola]|uniref:Lipoprotein n=1 Tax=Aquimarina algicola TaxID=2589995 RepID=A0A504J5W5_9FLAO|nr:hypothetical protein [Aquimarina algicola]TPN86266.1 hypothetical protein FHK87_13445 [Aquimarina algicola]